MGDQPKSRTAACVGLCALLGWIVAMPASRALAGQGVAPSDAIDREALGEQAVAVLQGYLRVDTSNPPGDEIAGARFLASYLEAADIPHEVFESEPGRGNLYARLEGDGSRGGAVVLLHHIDVVPADGAFWSADPFGGEVRDGFVWGRGTTDMKAFGAVQLVTFMALQRAGMQLGRDVILLATAGEETGGFEGAGWVVRQRPDLLEGVEFLLTEGATGAEIEDRIVHSIEVTQKTPLWLRLSVTGPAGHGSRPVSDSAVNRLVRALERIRTYRGEIKLVPPVAESLRARARFVKDPARAEAYRNVQTSISDPGFLRSLSEEMEPLLRNTISITVLAGSDKTNVVPPRASAELDCRLLPGEDPGRFIATLHDVIDDPGVEIETLLSFPASASSVETPLWRAIEEAVQQRWPEAVVVPAVSAGFTDSHFFRDRDIVAYGWAPFVRRPGEGPAHGTDERITVDNVRNGPPLLLEVLRRLAVVPQIQQ